MRPEKRSWSSRITQPGQSTNLLGQKRTTLVFALDQFNLPGKRYSFAHAKTACRPSCCGCVAWEVRTPPCHAPRERLGEMQGPIRNQNSRPQIFLDHETARARSQQRKGPQLTHGSRHGLPVSCRSSENSGNEAPPNADRSELRERRKHLVAKSVLFGPNLRL